MDQQFIFLIQDSFLIQHVLEPTRGENVLDIVLSSQNELVDNVKTHEPLGNSDHNQIHFEIKVKSESKNKKIQEKLPKGKYKDIKKYLAKLHWNNMLRNKTTIECWNILKYEIESIIDQFIPLKKQGKWSRKKHLSKEAIRKMWRKATKIIPELRNFSYEDRLKECGLITLETRSRRLREDQIEVFKILNGYENIDRNIFFTQER